jgi:hypothetical protein
MSRWDCVRTNLIDSLYNTQFHDLIPCLVYLNLYVIHLRLLYELIFLVINQFAYCETCHNGRLSHLFASHYQKFQNVVTSLNERITILGVHLSGALN